jgi:hypothetical protein
MSQKQLDRLLAVGFKPVGAWALDDEDLTLQLTDIGTALDTLYAFVTDGEVRYIGKTKKALRERLYCYLHPGPSQTTFIKVRRKVVEALSSGESVEIYALLDNGLISYGGFDLNLAAGLEDSLVAQFEPLWNKPRAKNLELFPGAGRCRPQRPP